MWNYLQNNSRILPSRAKIKEIGTELGEVLEDINTVSIWQPVPIAIPWKKYNRDFSKRVMLKGCICRSDHWLLRESTALPSTKESPDKLFLSHQATTYMLLVENLQDWGGYSCFCFFMTLCISAHFIILITLYYNVFSKCILITEVIYEYFCSNRLKQCLMTVKFSFFKCNISIASQLSEITLLTGHLYTEV